ncbi:UNVERIFIED_CONTAM: hypothetical protein GTU68_032010 [Idotea baltica]|nr:hypothetical protein [Idotea baltica]
MSACSDYFCEVFERISCRTPVVILKDIKQHDLEALLDYMYLGEVDIHESELTDVIKAAECLKIKGLAVPEDSPSFLSFKRPTPQSERTPSPPAKRVRKTRTSSEDEKKAKVADHTTLLTPKTEQSDSDNSTLALSLSPHSRSRSSLSSRSTLIPRTPPPLANPLSPISPLPSPKNNKTSPTIKFNIKSKSSSKRRACVGNTGSPSTLPKPVKIIKKTKNKAITGRQTRKNSSPSASSSSLSVGDNHKTFFFKYEEGEDPNASSVSSTADLQDSKEDLGLNGSTLSSDQAGPSGHAAPNKSVRFCAYVGM